MKQEHVDSVRPLSSLRSQVGALTCPPSISMGHTTLSCVCVFCFGGGGADTERTAMRKPRPKKDEHKQRTPQHVNFPFLAGCKGTHNPKSGVKGPTQKVASKKKTRTRTPAQCECRSSSGSHPSRRGPGLCTSAPLLPATPTHTCR